MGFCTQLRTLLWKNWILKKRAPFLLFGELLIPTVLFIILIVMNTRLPREPRPIVTHSAEPLTSAGIIPFLQGVCETRTRKNRDDWGFENYPYSIMQNFLGVLEYVTRGTEPKVMRKRIKHFFDYYGNKSHSHEEVSPVHQFFQELVPPGEELPQYIVSAVKDEEFITKLKSFVEVTSMLGDRVDSGDLEDEYLQQTWGSRGPSLYSTRVNSTGTVLQHCSAVLNPGNSTQGPPTPKPPSPQPTTRNSINDLTRGIRLAYSILQILICDVDPPPPPTPSPRPTPTATNAATTTRLPTQRPPNTGGTPGSGDPSPSQIFETVIRELIRNKMRFLYSPTYTAADDIIQEARGTLSIIPAISDLMVAWLRLSRDIRAWTDSPNFNRLIVTLIRALYDLLKRILPTRGPNNFVPTFTPGVVPSKEDEILGSKVNTAKDMYDELQQVIEAFQKENPNVANFNDDSSKPETYINKKTVGTTSTPKFTPPRRTTYPWRRTTYRRGPSTTLRVGPDVLQEIRRIILIVLNALDTGACRWLQIANELGNLALFEGFRTEDELVRYTLQEAKYQNVTVLGGVVFNTRVGMAAPNHITYKIRLNATFTPPTKYFLPPQYSPGTDWVSGLYYQLGFLSLQDMIDRAIISYQTGKEVVHPGVYLQHVPVPCHLYIGVKELVKHMVPLGLYLSWIFPVALFVKSVVAEKEYRLKEVMKIMGLTDSVLRFSWGITASIQATITVTVLSVLLKYAGLLTFSDVSVIFVLLFIYSMAAIQLGFLVCAFFTNAKQAAAYAGITYLILYIPYTYFTIMDESTGQVPLWMYVVTCLFSPSAIGLSGRYISHYEFNFVGLQWSNFFQRPNSLDKFSIGYVCIMLAIDTVLYGTLAWYIETVFPGDYGLPQPWYFPVSKRYWCGSSSKRGQGDEDCQCTSSQGCSCFRKKYRQPDSDMNDVTQAPGYHFETEPKHLPLGIVINGLRKVYSNGKVAVDNLNLKLYQGQILSFLGHNGAGKTTTMSILTGMFPATDGYAEINGLDTRTDMKQIRTSLGMCPQYNVLFDSMTVMEHLQFYANLKGVKKSIFKEETESILKDTALENKRHNNSCTLSGGMKRKLSVGIAFIGGSKTVILDEPTAGVDPHSRRDIWELLIKYKSGRTIMLSTHHMDEADILGDRIAIISHGMLRCCGSPLFLKTTFGEGYHLTVVKGSSGASDSSDSGSSGPSANPSLSGASVFDGSSHSLGGGSTIAGSDRVVPTRDSFSTSRVTTFIRCNVPAAQLKDENKRELHYILPFSQTHTVDFGHLFDQLDLFSEKLKIRSYGVSDTSLEEVFLRVVQGETETKQDQVFSLPTRFRDSCDLSIRSGNKERGQVSISGSENRGSGVMTHRRSASALPRGIPQKVMTPAERAFLRSISLDASFYSPTSSVADLNSMSGGSDLDGMDECHGAGSYKVKGIRLHWQQFIACLWKRVLYTCRNWKTLIVMIVLPCTLVTVAMTTGVTQPQVTDNPPITLSPSQYYNMTEYGVFMPYSHQHRYTGRRTTDAGPEDLIKTFKWPAGIGADCTLRNSFVNMTDVDWRYLTAENVTRYYSDECQSVFYPQNRPKDQEPGLYGLITGVINDMADLINGLLPFSQDQGLTEAQHRLQNNRSRYYPNCTCKKDYSGFECRSDGFRLPPDFRVITRDVLQNITFQNESKYTLYTTDMYKNTRYGGIAFGTMNDFIPWWWREMPLELKNIQLRHTAKVLYNSHGYHSAPAYLNVMNNAILRANMPKEKGHPSAYGITVINHPMNGTVNVFLLESILVGPDLVISIFIVAGLSFVPAAFSFYIVHEQSKRIKQLQFISGLSGWVYWAANIIWDLVTVMCPLVICIGILAAFGIPAYTQGGNLAAISGLILLFGWSVTPLMYILSWRFSEPSAAYVFLVIFNLGVGILLLCTVFMLNFFDNRSFPTIQIIKEVLQWVFSVIPTYSLGQGIMNVAVNHHISTVLRIGGFRSDPVSPFSWDIVLRNYVFLAVGGVIHIILVLLLEYNFFVHPRAMKEQNLPPVSDRDPDVELERQRVETALLEDQDVLQLRNVTKFYNQTRGQGKYLAVRRLTLGVPQGECFGLLGVNGAGKTTTFKMLTGELPVSGGDATILGLSIRKESRKVRQKIGYCPQFDALFDELTAKEHLYLYARLRGIPPEDQDRVVQWAIKKLDLTKYADKPSGTYSGGNKRKLSTALALIGNPSVIFLDEPTAGMDPYAKRFLWNLVLGLIRDGKCIVLTSHSMEECEMLCSRLAIMVAGQFVCLGSVQHLKSRFGDGYTIKLKVKGDDIEGQMDKIQRYIQRHFPHAQLKARHLKTQHYEIESANLNLTQLFNKMEIARRRQLIDDYSVSQNTLDNVFINFVQEQYASPEVDSISVTETVESPTDSTVLFIDALSDSVIPKGSSLSSSVRVEDSRGSDNPAFVDENITNCNNNEIHTARTIQTESPRYVEMPQEQLRSSESVETPQTQTEMPTYAVVRKKRPEALWSVETPQRQTEVPTYAVVRKKRSKTPMSVETPETQTEVPQYAVVQKKQFKSPRHGDTPQRLSGRENRRRPEASTDVVVVDIHTENSQLNEPSICDNQKPEVTWQDNEVYETSPLPADSVTVLEMTPRPSAASECGRRGSGNLHHRKRVKSESSSEMFTHL